MFNTLFAFESSRKTYTTRSGKLSPEESKEFRVN